MFWAQPIIGEVMHRNTALRVMVLMAITIWSPISSILLYFSRHDFPQGSENSDELLWGWSYDGIMTEKILMHWQEDLRAFWK